MTIEYSVTEKQGSGAGQTKSVKAFAMRAGEFKVWSRHAKLLWRSSYSLGKEYFLILNTDWQ